MIRKLSILILLLLMGVSTTHGAATIIPSTVGTVDLAGKTSVTVTGAWTAEDLATLKTQLADAKMTLQTCDMGAATFSGTGHTFYDMFYGFTALTTVTLPSVGSGNEISFYAAFQDCTSLTTIDISKFTNISSLAYTFVLCESLETLTLPAGTSSESISFQGAFTYCPLLTSIDISAFTNISDLVGAFDGCERLETLTLPAGTSSESISFNSALMGCTSLTTIDISAFTNISEMAYTFYGCANLTSVILPAGTTYADNISFQSAFRNCEALQSIDIAGFTKVSTMQRAFYGCSNLTSVFLGGIPAATGDNIKNTFAGANPNCLKHILADSFENTDDTWTNIVLPGSEPNTWQVVTDIVLDGEAPFLATTDMKATDGKTISYTMDITNCKTTYDGVEEKVVPAWTTIVLPFDALIVHPDKNDGSYLRVFDESTGRGDYLLREYTASEAVGEVTFTDVTTGSIKANTPYLITFLAEIGLAGNGVAANAVTFVATEDSIAATPEEGIVVGNDNHFFSSFYQPMDETNTDGLYVLSGDAFEKASGLAIGTFQAFFMDDPEAPTSATSLSIGGGILTGVPQVAPPSGGWGVGGGKGYLRIESGQARQIVLYTATGMVVRTIVLTEGTNYVNGLQPGIYIVEGKKAVVL